MPKIKRFLFVLSRPTHKTGTYTQNCSALSSVHQIKKKKDLKKKCFGEKINTIM